MSTPLICYDKCNFPDLIIFLQAIQQVIDNLLISHIEIRSEESIDIQKYVHNRKIEKVVVPFSSELLAAKKTFLGVSILIVYNVCPTSL